MAAGCSADGEPGSETVSSISQAVESPVGQEQIQIAVSLPESASLGRVAVAASQSLTVADRVKIFGDASVSSGIASVGVEANTGNLDVRDQVTLRDRAHVLGSVFAKSVQRGNSVLIDGGVTLRPTPAAPVSVAWTVSVGSASLGPVQLEPDLTRDLPPGKYTTFSVKSRSSVTLHSGVYALDDFTLEPQAKLRIDDRDGPVQVVVKGNFTYRGQIVSAIGESPQLLFAVQGSSVMVEAPFTGALLAPNAQVRFQAARPDGHKAFIYGAQVSLEPDTKIYRLPFDWSTVVGTDFDPIPPDAIVRDISEGDLDISVNVPADGSGTHFDSGKLTKSERFRLRDKYTVAGGTIGNGTATFRFRLGSGNWTTCTYKGQSPTATPTTAADLLKGTLLVLQSCSDGLPPGNWRTGDQFDLTVNPSPGYHVIIDSPLLRPEACDDAMEMLTVAQARDMRAQFDWSKATKVDGQNPDGTPTLFYAWVYVRNKAEALNLKKLYVHVLSRPLFDEELLKFGGRCGSFTNPGDGTGMFVPVLLPGKTYNKLIDALRNGDLSGDRTIFDAVILRNDVPASVRNANGSVSLQALKAANFHYLDYEASPFANPATMTLDAGGSKILVDAVAWVGQAARDVGEAITGVLGDIDQIFRGGGIDITFHLRAITRDTSFGNQAMVRNWGTYAGSNLGATGMQVKIIQRTAGIIPITQHADTNINGKVTVEASPGADVRRSGLCVELRTKAALVTDFLMPNEICDLRGYIDDNDTSTAQEVKKKFKFSFDKTATYDLHIDNTRMTGLYQADDVYRYAKTVMDFEAPRARMLSGYWAATFAPKDGTKLFTPCLNFPNTLSDLMMAVGGVGGGLAGADIGSIIPALGTLAGTAVGAVVGSAFGAVVGQTDIVMTLKSDLRRSRGVMSHEYGHYEFCSLLFAANPLAVDHVIWGTIGAGNDTMAPLRYTNEAVAEYFMGQVTSGSNYGWMDNARYSSSDDAYCANDQPDCWDKNYFESSTGDQNIGRVASMFLDMFDGHGGDRKANVPNNGNGWQACTDPPVTSPAACMTNADCGAGERCVVDAANNSVCLCSTLTYRSSTGYGDLDRMSSVGIPERVHMSGKEMKGLANRLAAGLGPFVHYTNDGWGGNAIDEPKLRKAINDTMVEAKQNWCDRCVVLALHDTKLNTKIRDTPGALLNAASVYEACNSDPDLVAALGEAPPEASLRINSVDCSACGPNEVSTPNGTCEPCLAGEVVGNSCNKCKADVVLEAGTMPLENDFDVTVPTPGDNCPDKFWVEINNPADLFTTNKAVDFAARVAPLAATAASCGRSWSLSSGFPDPATNYFTETTQSSTGSVNSCTGPGPCFGVCSGLPSIALTPMEATGPVIRFGTPVVPGGRLIFLAHRDGKGPG